MIPEPLIAGQVAGRLWGYGHRERRLQPAEIIPAAAEQFRIAYGALQSLSMHERDYYWQRFVDGFREGVPFWGSVEGMPVSRPERPDSEAGHLPSYQRTVDTLKGLAERLNESPA